MPPPYGDQHDAGIHRYLETGERRIVGIGGVILGRRKDGSSACRAVIESHGGPIAPAPCPGAGTIYSFTLPAVAPAGSETAAARP